MKNIYETEVRGKKKYCVQVLAEDGKRKKKYFDGLLPAKSWLKNFNDNKSNFDLNELEKLQIADIRLALSLLPKGITLSQCVKAFNAELVNIPLDEAIKNFLANKKNLSSKYYANIKKRLEKFKEHFKEWENVSPTLISKWCSNISSSTKSQKHYFAITKEFYEYAETKKYAKNPFREIHKSEVQLLKEKK